MEERVRQLEKELYELKEYFRTHKHLGYDKSQRISTSTSPGGSTTQIQYNNAGAFAGDDDLTWDSTNKELTVGVNGNSVIRSEAGLNVQAATDINITTDAGAYATGAITLSVNSPTSGNFSAGNITLDGGNGSGTGSGSTLLIQSGDGGASDGSGGTLNIAAGNGAGTGSGGTINLTVGAGGASGDAGDVVIGRNLTTTTRNGGFVYIPTSAGAPTGTPVGATGRVAMVFDTTNNKLMVYDGGWIGVTLA